MGEIIWMGGLLFYIYRYNEVYYGLNMSVVLMALNIYKFIINSSFKLKEITVKESEGEENKEYLINNFNCYQNYTSDQLKQMVADIPIFNISLSIFISIFQQDSILKSRKPKEIESNQSSSSSSSSANDKQDESKIPKAPPPPPAPAASTSSSSRNR